MTLHVNGGIGGRPKSTGLFVKTPMFSNQYVIHFQFCDSKAPEEIFVALLQQTCGQAVESFEI